MLLLAFVCNLSNHRSLNLWKWKWMSHTLNHVTLLTPFIETNNCASWQSVFISKAFHKIFDWNSIDSFPVMCSHFLIPKESHRGNNAWTETEAHLCYATTLFLQTIFMIKTSTEPEECKMTDKYILRTI